MGQGSTETGGVGGGRLNVLHLVYVTRETFDNAPSGGRNMGKHWGGGGGGGYGRGEGRRDCQPHIYCSQTNDEGGGGEGGGGCRCSTPVLVVL